MKIQISLSAKGADKNEVFRFFNMVFYPGKAWQLMQEKKVKPTLEEFHIEEWAKQFLALNRDKPDEKALGFIRVDHDYAKTLDEERINEPGMIVVTKIGAVLIDGQHRLARRYLSGLDTMPVYVFTEKQAKKHKIML